MRICSGLSFQRKTTYFQPTSGVARPEAARRAMRLEVLVGPVEVATALVAIDHRGRDAVDREQHVIGQKAASRLRSVLTSWPLVAMKISISGLWRRRISNSRAMAGEKNGSPRL